MRTDKRRGRSENPLILRRFLLVFILTALSCTIARDANAQVWIGTGYDGISESYYLATLDSNIVSLDSLEQLRRTATTIHEAEIYVRSQVDGMLRWEQTSSLTSEAWQHRSLVELISERTQSVRGRVSYDLDHRETHDNDSGTAFSSHSNHRLQAEGEWRGADVESRLRGTGEYVSYPDDGGLLHDYWQVRSEWRLGLVRDDFEEESITLQQTHREAPDSVRFGYDEWSATGRVPWYTGQVRFQSWLQAADRRYAEGGRTDFSSVRGEVTWRDDGWPARWPGKVSVEGYNYYAGDAFLPDYVRVDGEQRVQFAISPTVTGYVEPGVERYASDAAEDYWEPRVSLGGEYMDFGGMMATGDVSLGRRLYDGGVTDLFSSDYWRLTIDVLVDGPVWGKVTTSLLVSQDWEWHKSSSDDLSVSLVSVGVRYRL